MITQETPQRSPALRLALLISLILHGLILFVPRHPPSLADRPSGRLEAALRPRLQTPAPPDVVPATQNRPVSSKPKSQAIKRVIAVDPTKARKSTATPQWTTAEKKEMTDFLDELDSRNPVRPDLAQRSLAMAREYGRQQALQEAAGSDMIERLPNSPPLDPFSLELYLDALVKKLNRSAAFVKNDPRSRGVKSATVQVRLNPDGSLLSFKVLNAADQHGEIAFIKSVVEQAVPFSAFPADMRRSARSLNMLICIRPPSLSGSFGFSRSPEGGRC